MINTCYYICQAYFFNVTHFVAKQNADFWNCKWHWNNCLIEMKIKNTPTKYTFSSNHNILKSSHGLCFWASDPLIDKFRKNLSTKGSEAQKQRPDELLWMLWFDVKSIFNVLCLTNKSWIPLFNYVLYYQYLSYQVITYYFRYEYIHWES